MSDPINPIAAALARMQAIRSTSGFHVVGVDHFEEELEEALFVVELGLPTQSAAEQRAAQLQAGVDKAATEYLVYKGS